MKTIKLLFLALLLTATTEAQDVKWSGKDNKHLAVERDELVVIVDATAQLATRNGFISAGRVLTTLSGSLILGADSALAYDCQLFAETLMRFIKEQEYLKMKEDEERNKMN